jgi:hypothetical protein
MSIVRLASPLFLLVSACLGLAAFGPSSSPAPARSAEISAPSAQPAAAADPKATCVAVLQRMRACSEPFIPALVDLRVRYDRPAGIAAAAAAEGHDTWSPYRG